MNREEEMLLSAFQNSYDDLSANRLGRLSSAQQRKLFSNAKWKLILMSLCFFLVTMLFYTFEGLAATLLFAPLLVIGFVIGLIICVKHIYQLHAAVAKGHVESLLGQIELDSSTREWNRGWFFNAAGQSFNLPTFHPWNNYKDPTYRGYIIPDTHRIIAIEPVYEIPFSRSSVG